MNWVHQVECYQAGQVFIGYLVKCASGTPCVWDWIIKFRLISQALELLRLFSTLHVCGVGEQKVTSGKVGCWRWWVGSLVVWVDNIEKMLFVYE